MIELTQKQESKLVNFKQDCYSLRGWLTHLDDTKYNFEDVCFRALKTRVTPVHLEASKSITFALTNNITPVFERAHIPISSIEICQEFIEDLTEFGIVTNLVTTDGAIIQITFDVDTTSAREIFFVGNMFRTIQNWPAVVYDYFKLKNLYPDIDKWKLFYIAHLILLGDYRILLNNNHCHLDFNSFGYLSDSPSQTLEKIRSENWGTLKSNQCFSYNLDKKPVLLQPILLSKPTTAFSDSIISGWRNYRKNTYLYGGIDAVVKALLSEEALTLFLQSDKFKSYSKPTGDW